MSDRHDLPPFLARIAEIAGLPAAIAVARARGGGKAYFPRHPKAGHWLVEAVGPRAAEAICRELVSSQTGDKLEVPFGPAGSYAEIRRRAARLEAEGHSTTVIARTCGITERTVRRSRARRRADPRQGSFDLPEPPPLSPRDENR